MKDDTEELGLKGSIVCFMIRFNSINTYKNVRLNGAWFIGVRKSNNVGKRIMIKKRLVEVGQVSICTKNIIQFSQPYTLLFEKMNQESFESFSVWKSKWLDLIVKMDRRI